MRLKNIVKVLIYLLRMKLAIYNYHLEFQELYDDIPMIIVTSVM
jgi:hypothetical protein